MTNIEAKEKAFAVGASKFFNKGDMKEFFQYIIELAIENKKNKN